jgi:hypothetical protein
MRKLDFDRSTMRLNSDEAKNYADPAALSSGFHRAVLIAAVLCASGGLLSAFTIRDDVLTRPAGRPARPAEPELAEDVDFAACRCQAALTTPTLPRR